MGGDHLQVSYWLTGTGLKSTPPAWAGTYTDDSRAINDDRLKSTPPAWAGTSRRRSGRSDRKCLNPPRPHGRGLPVASVLLISTEA